MLFSFSLHMMFILCAVCLTYVFSAAGLVPDKGGMYSLWVKKPYQGYTHEVRELND